MVLPSKRKRGKERQLRQQQQERRLENSDDGGDDEAQDTTDTRSSVVSETPSHAPSSLGMALLYQWSNEEGHVGIVLHVLSFLDVTKLVEKKQVCKKWKELCTQAIDNKCKNPYDFETTDGLRFCVKKYCKELPHLMEEIATDYGYPINKWRVHLLEDFSWVFSECRDFNDYIGDWDMSNAKDLEGMFWGAWAFNQDLSKWNTSKVTNMGSLFSDAHSFNQCLNSWDMSSVVLIESMFWNAIVFNQPVDSWDTSQIENMNSTFSHAESFNQSLSSWNTNSVEEYRGFLHQATAFNQALPTGFEADRVFARGDIIEDDED